MTSAWFVGSTMGVPQDESVVRSTVEPIRHDPNTAQEVDAPDFNELDTDESGQLTGLSHRMLAPDTRDTTQYGAWWIPGADANHNVIIDNQVATSGTAAAREAAGVQGHGTMQYALGIEPVIRDGSRFGNDYFTTAPNIIQDGAGAYMTPANNDQWTGIAAQSNAIAESRQAFQSTQWANFMGGN